MAELNTAAEYEGLGLMVGLEIHQQLKTKKLFCNCKSVLRTEPPNVTVKRQLHSVSSEVGTEDAAAIEASLKKHTFTYEAYTDTCCLVELDEEPPRPLNPAAQEIALIIAKSLNTTIMDELHVMRKTIIDGSCTSGFQRTLLVGLDGKMRTLGGKDIGIESVCLEEDAAKIVGKNTFRLDRLAIPLVEIATGPDMRTPQEALDAARTLGLLLRSSGKVMRGIGTIRQDLNVSIKDGARVEIKGVQELRALPQMVELEVERQLGLLRLREQFSGKIAEAIDAVVVKDVTDIFRNCETKIVKKGLSCGLRVFAASIPGISGIMNANLGRSGGGARFGKEVSGYVAGRTGCAGFFNTDEALCEKYGFKEREIGELKTRLGVTGESSLVCFTCWSTERPILAIVERLRIVSKGVPVETRKCLPDGTSVYMRPLPGAGRFYPETDIPPIVVDFAKIRTLPPVDEQIRELTDLGLNEKLALDVLLSERKDVFDHAVADLGLSPTLVAGILEEVIPALRRDCVNTDAVSDARLSDLFGMMSRGMLTREVFPDAVRMLADGKEYVPCKGASVDEVRQVVREVIGSKKEFTRTSGMRALGGLMGLVMEKLKGRASGTIINQLLREELEEFLGKP